MSKVLFSSRDTMGEEMVSSLILIKGLRSLKRKFCSQGPPQGLSLSPARLSRLLISQSSFEKIASAAKGAD
jgi:hypothetical protein